MSLITIEYNFPIISDENNTENAFKGINLKLINEEHKLIISSISDEDYKETVPDHISIIIQMTLPNIELMCILNLSLLSAEVIGKGVFCRMFSFEELVTHEYIDEIKILPCVRNRIQSEDENLLLDRFLVFCGSVVNILSPLIEEIIQNPEVLKSIFKESLELIN
jgi:hypothetical protein